MLKHLLQICQSSSILIFTTGHKFLLFQERAPTSRLTSFRFLHAANVSIERTETVRVTSIKANLQLVLEHEFWSV